MLGPKWLILLKGSTFWLNREADYSWYHVRTPERKSFLPSFLAAFLHKAVPPLQVNTGAWRISRQLRRVLVSGRVPDSHGATMSAERAKLRQDRCYRREIWALQPPPTTAAPHSAGYVGELQTHLLCNTFFFPSPTRSAATELVRDISSSSLLPWMKRVSINWLLMRKTRV